MQPIDVANAKLEKNGIQPSLLARWRSLAAELASFPAAVIAYSGGVDSGLLAYAAAQVLGERSVAVTIVTPLEPAGVIERAADFARQHGIRYDVIFHDPLQNPIIQANPPDRCYHCKAGILRSLWDYARANGLGVVLEGQNADDRLDYRPGQKAVVETGTISPLANNGLTKADIRRLAKAFDLPIWDLPSSPCLATRIPYHVAITKEALGQIALAESYLHERGFKVVRVRWHQDLARIEIDPSQIQALLEIRTDLVDYFKKIGFHYTTLDLLGYRLGSMNEGLSL